MIVHIDMDAFYASVEQRDNSSLQAKPVIVGGPASGRGVVSAASYEARKFGVHSAMPTATAKRLCPEAVFITPRMAHYAAIAKQIRTIFFRYTSLVEPLSLDEAFLDVSGSERLFGPAADIGRRIQADIDRELNLAASAGVAPNKFLAKLASDLEKPNGFVVVDPNRIQDFLDPLPVSRIWGVGKVTQKAFDRIGVRSVQQLRRLGADVLSEQFGDFGLHLWKLAQGLDDRQVVPDRMAKSISHEVTLAVDVDDDETIRGWLLELSDQVGRRLRRNEFVGRSVQLKIRFQDFRTVTRSMQLVNATCVTDEIYNAARELLEQRVQVSHRIRLIGVGVSKLEANMPRQKMLFDEPLHELREQTDRTADEIRRRFGQESVTRATRLLHGTRHRPLPNVTDREQKEEGD